MAVDLASLWDFGNPQVSEDRFRDLLADADADDAWVLRTQIARTYGLRRDFEGARALLRDLEPGLADSSAEGQVRYWLELGRTYASAAHSPESQTDEAKATAKAAYLEAFEVARAARLDGLAVDALHMMTMVETSPSDQIKWNLRAISYMDASDQREAKQWEASLRNNLGYALYLAGSYEEALTHFEIAHFVRENAGKDGPTRIAAWMVAWTLRALHRYDEALSIQHRLEKQWADDGQEDHYVFEELEHLYRAKGDEEKASYYRSKQPAS
ncbi:MAG: tetratricopeptide repeat protein [Fimbriimonas sp.]